MRIFVYYRDRKTKGIFALKLIDKQMVKEKEMEA